MENLKDIFGQLTAALRDVPVIYLIVVGVILLLSIIIPIVLRSIKKGKADKVKPNLNLKSFQVSPLGRDAWLRLNNNGHLAILKEIKIKKRKDIIVSTDFRNIKINQSGTASLFLNANGEHRIRENFEVEFIYADSIGNLYKQRLNLENKVFSKAKLQ